LHVARSRRQVDHQIVELAPIHAAQKLLDDAVQHGAAPHQRLVAGIEEAHGHQLDAELVERLDAVAIRHRGAVHAHHQRHIGAVDVGIHEAHLYPSDASPTARFTATVVFPTPPFPEPTAIRFFTPGMGILGIWPG
jgi:hypothetical protein